MLQAFCRVYYVTHCRNKFGALLLSGRLVRNPWHCRDIRDFVSFRNESRNVGNSERDKGLQSARAKKEFLAW